MYEIISRESSGVLQYGIRGNGVKIYDITVHRREIAFSVFLLNYYEVSHVHIYDVLEDAFGYLAEPGGTIQRMQQAYEASYGVV